MAGSVSENNNHASESRTIIIATPDDFPKVERPRCSECGTIPMSRGSEWCCSNCGHRWVKVRRKCKDCPYRGQE
jgi:tRNA(Ile2) C34 agmatinyltransferase TiaS